MGEPNYYAVIPANVRYDHDLIPNAKLLYGEITALSNQKGFCWASDSYFSNLYSVSKATIQNWLKSLETAGYIGREVKYKDGTKQIESRYIRILVYPTQEKLSTPTQEILRENTTSINTTNTGQSHDDPKPTILDDFEELWKLYPRKRGKQSAFKAYKRALKKGTTNKQIQTGIMGYINDIHHEHIGQEYIAWGGTFFNQERWADYLDEQSSQPKPQAPKDKDDRRRMFIKQMLDQYSALPLEEAAKQVAAGLARDGTHITAAEVLKIAGENNERN